RNIGEREFPHLATLALVAFAVAVEGRLPAFCLVAARRESQLVRPPVSLHEALEVAAVPGLDLVVEDAADCLLVGTAGSAVPVRPRDRRAARRCGSGREQQHAEG